MHALIYNVELFGGRKTPQDSGGPGGGRGTQGRPCSRPWLQALASRLFCTRNSITQSRATREISRLKNTHTQFSACVYTASNFLYFCLIYLFIFFDSCTVRLSAGKHTPTGSAHASAEGAAVQSSLSRAQLLSNSKKTLSVYSRSSFHESAVIKPLAKIELKLRNVLLLILPKIWPPIIRRSDQRSSAVNSSLYFFATQHNFLSFCWRPCYTKSSRYIIIFDFFLSFFFYILIYDATVPRERP